MDHFPIFLDIRSRRVLVVGDTHAAQAKVRLLQAAGAAPQVALPRDFQAADVAACAVVIAATGDDELDRRVSAAAKAAGVPVNVVDRPDLSTFIVPAIVDRGPVVVAISTGGAAPVLARRLRAQIEALLPARLGELARLAARFRRAVRELVPDVVVRRRFWEQFFDGPLAERVLAGDTQVAGKFVGLINRGPQPPAGRVDVVDAPREADELTLRALRLLQAADLVLHEGEVPPEVLARARRDAEHCSGDGLDARAAEAARAGRRVVWLRAAAVSPPVRRLAV